MKPQFTDAISLATAIRDGQMTAKDTITHTLTAIEQNNPAINCFTKVMAEEAILTAESVDLQLSQGKNIGLLAGVPFAVKNLYDVAGLPTLAGSKINANHPPASHDATAVRRLKQAGAILVGTLNMDEYAYGFVTENSHYGTTHNPHDLSRIAGGSSGGSAAAVAADLVPISLGSDTNGSIRVPAAFCGILGFKPTYGRLSRAGTFLFSNSLDCIGSFARSVRDIATTFDILMGEDGTDPICTRRPPQFCLPQLDLGIDGLRIAVAADYFRQGADTEALEVVERVAQILGVKQEITIPEAHRARAAAFIITAAEGANLHLANLRSRLADFDPATRDRFLAGALIPSSWYIQAQRFRTWYRDRLQEIFQQVDIILAPTTPCVAPLIGKEKIIIAGEEIAVRPHLGIFTQPISFVGLPVLSFPIISHNILPLGVQIIAAPYKEALIFRVARILENYYDSL